MKIFLSFVLLAFALTESNAAGTNCKCGWRNTKRIVGGSEAVKNEYPWTAALMLGSHNFCGGTVVSPHHIITAAHCTKNHKPEEVSVIVGAHDLTNLNGQPAQTHRIERFIDHPQFDFDKQMNDISILVTKTPIEFNNFVGPACFPHKMIHNKDLTGHDLQTMGWGNTISTGSNDDRMKMLKHVTTGVVAEDRCFRTWRYFAKDSTQLCTYSPDGEACRGDSGGPLVYLDPETKSYTLLGAASYGPGDCGSGAPFVYTNVPAYRQWILSQINAKTGAEVCTMQ